MKHKSSELFNRQGFILAQEYIDDINTMRKSGSWKLPLGVMDRVHLFFLSLFLNFSWFSDNLYIKHVSNMSPFYFLLVTYLKKKSFFDFVKESTLYSRGYYHFYFEKEVVLESREYKMSGQGISEDISEAFSKALGEMLERSITGIFDMNKDIVTASVGELMVKNAVIYPPKYHRFLPIQKSRIQKLQHSKTEVLSWVRGTNLVTKEKTYIPKKITSWFMEGRSSKSFLVHPTTNGSAAYFTKEGATLRALLEVIQRDAFLVHWLTMIPPQVVIMESLPESIQEKVKELTLFGIEITILNITALPVPTVLIVAKNNQAELPQVAISSSSSLVFEEAIHNALREILLVIEMFTYIDEKLVQGYEKRDIEPFVSTIDKIGRQLYWRGEERVKQFDWFISGEEVSFKDVSELDIISESESQQLEIIIGKLKMMGPDYYPAVYFPKNKIQEKIGFYTAQVFIPKAFPLYLTEFFGTFDSDRLEDFALSKGIKKWKLNTEPHMFS